MLSESRCPSPSSCANSSAIPPAGSNARRSRRTCCSAPRAAPSSYASIWCGSATNSRPRTMRSLRDFLTANEAAVETDQAGALIDDTLAFVPEELRGQWRRQWLNAHEKGTRQLVPALVDVHNPGVTGGVQNQPDFQAGSVDHRTHFVSEVPHLAREVMKEYSTLTGREYAPVLTYIATTPTTSWSASARSPTTCRRSRPICARRARRSASSRSSSCSRSRRPSWSPRSPARRRSPCSSART